MVNMTTLIISTIWFTFDLSVSSVPRPCPIRPPPLTIIIGGGRKEEGGGKEGGGRIPPSFSLPLFPSPLVRPIWGAHQPLVAVCFPSWPIRPISFARGARNPFRWPNKYPVPPRNTFGIRISSSYISIFTSRPFRDSSSCRDLIQDSKQHSITK